MLPPAQLCAKAGGLFVRTSNLALHTSAFSPLPEAANIGSSSCDVRGANWFFREPGPFALRGSHLGSPLSSKFDVRSMIFLNPVQFLIRRTCPAAWMPVLSAGEDSGAVVGWCVPAAVAWCGGASPAGGNSRADSLAGVILTAASEPADYSAAVSEDGPRASAKGDDSTGPGLNPAGAVSLPDCRPEEVSPDGPECRPEWTPD